MRSALQGVAAGVLAVSLAGVAGVSADYDSARKALDRKDFRAGIAALRAAARDGDARAQNHLGTLFEDGRIVDRDFDRAAFWYRKSADQGNAHGQLNLGRMYRGGIGLKRDERQAVYWYRAAAGQGLAAAQFFLGLMYESGRGVERDLAKSWMWFSLAAEQGDEDARFRCDRLTGELDEGGLAAARAALRGYREAAAARRPEPAPAEPDAGFAAESPGPEPKGGAPSRAEPPPVRGNPLVFRIQAALIELGYSPGEHDGDPGSRTRDAVRRFEAEHGYRRSGRLDERSLRRLRKAIETGWPALSVVQEIQTNLRRLGHAVGVIDGKPGPRTAAAVETFQRKHGLPADGRLSVDLLRQLRETDP